MILVKRPPAIRRRETLCLVDAMLKVGTVRRHSSSNFDMRPFNLFAPLLALAAAALAGCASVTTEITVLDPAHKFAPTEYVMLLLDYPPKPYVKIALIEAQGIVGGSEAALLEEARKRGAALGADAIVREEVTAFYQPPVLVYDPAYANMFYPRYRYPYRSFYYPYAYAPF